MRREKQRILMNDRWAVKKFYNADTGKTRYSVGAGDFNGLRSFRTVWRAKAWAKYMNKDDKRISDATVRFLGAEWKEIDSGSDN